MLRSAFSVACKSAGICNRFLATATPAITTLPTLIKQHQLSPPSRSFTVLTSAAFGSTLPSIATAPRILQLAAPVVVTHQPSRTLTKFSIRTGKRKSVKNILTRFKRLHWGGWIRTICGRNKKLSRKKSSRRRRLRQHVLVNSTQARLLDKMVGPYWRKPRHFINDPYEPYHERDYTYARHKPIEYWPTKEEYRKR